MQWLRAAVPCVPIALTAHHFLGGVTIVRARSAENQEAHNDHIAQQQEQKQQEDKDKGRSGSFPQWPEAVAYESVSTRRCRFVRHYEIGEVELTNFHSDASLRQALFDPINHTYI